MPDQEKMDAFAELKMLRQTIAAFSPNDPELAAIDDMLGKLRARQYTVAVVGEFNRGKSSLINALLGMSVLPADITPTTATVNRVVYSETPYVRLHMRNGETEGVSMSMLKDRVTKLSAEAQSAAEAVKEAEIGYPTVFCKNNVAILDTPGLNDCAEMDALTFAKMEKAGVFHVFYAALNQSFFTLSIGMGGMEIYGSYIGKEKSLTGEAVIVTALDTFVAIVAGLIIFPACYAFGISPDAGPGLIFKTLPPVFAEMPLGRVWGTMFFIFLFCAALSTMIGVFENDQAFLIDLRGMKRQRAGIINGLVIAVMSVPCALGFNLWSRFQPLRAGNSVMDLEDFFVSDIVLPVGSFIFCLFCTMKYGWGFDRYMEEVNTGTGMKVSPKLRFYFKYILPCIIGFLVIYGLVTYFV